MGNKIVIDTCVAIDLNEDKVDFLEKFLDCLGDDEIYISTVNFEELKDDFKITNALKGSKRVHVVKNDENEFSKFIVEIEDMAINLSRNDAHVLFLAKELNANYVASSDINVFRQTQHYRKHRKDKQHLKPLDTALLLQYLYKNNKINGIDFSEKTLNLYKHKEIDNVLDHMINKQNLNCQKEKQIEIMNDYKKMLKERFEMYRKPIVDEFGNLWSLRIQT